MTIALTPIAMKAVPMFWPVIVGELDAVAARCNELWRGSDVLRAIATGDAFLCIAYDGETPIGYMIYQIATTPFSKDLHIWVAGGGTLERMDEFWPLIREIRDLNGCTAISFESPRRWERALKFLEVRYLYREGI